MGYFNVLEGLLGESRRAEERAISTFLRDCSESLDALATAEDLDAGMTAWGITQAMEGSLNERLLGKQNASAHNL